jgi:hypothetical protein
MRAQDLNVEQPEIGERLGAGPPRATRDEPLVRRPRRGLGARAHRRGPAPTLASAVLVGVMAVRSPINAHPDEVLHLVAGQYFREHWLPPPVGGTSYLDEADIVYWAFGKALALGNGLRLAPSTAMRPRSRGRWASSCWDPAGLVRLFVYQRERASFSRCSRSFSWSWVGQTPASVRS